MPGSLSYDKQTYFKMALGWAKRLRNASFPESAAALYVQANRGQTVPVKELTKRLDGFGVPRCSAGCLLNEVRSCIDPGPGSCTQCVAIPGQKTSRLTSPAQ